MKFLTRIIACVMFSVIFNSALYASNLSGLNYSPAFYFTDQDWKIFQATADKALNQSRDNVKFSWRNPKSGAWGYVIPSRTASNNKMTCRNLTLFNSAHEVTGKATYQFCKIGGEWKILN
jgi:surface antigen